MKKLMGLGAISLMALFMATSAAQAAEHTAAKKPPAEKTSDVVSHDCHNGYEVRIVTPDREMHDALVNLFDGKIRPDQFLNFVAQHTPDDADRAVDMLSKCLNIRFERA